MLNFTIWEDNTNNQSIRKCTRYLTGTATTYCIGRKTHATLASTYDIHNLCIWYKL